MMDPNPPAIVREQEHDAVYWDKKAVIADQSRSDSSIDHAEALYYLKREDSFKELGYKSMQEYAFQRFGKSKSWLQKLIAIHEKFIVELGKTKDDLKEVGFGKVSKLVSVVDINNVDQILNDSKNMSQKEIDDKIKEAKGLEPNETEEQGDDGEKIIKMSFKMPEAAAESIRTYLDIARDQYCEGKDLTAKQVMDFQALELVTVGWGLSQPLTGGKEEALESMFSELETLHNIDIEWKVREE